jgi:hypothetical protein
MNVKQAKTNTEFPEILLFAAKNLFRFARDNPNDERRQDAIKALEELGESSDSEE